MLLTSALDINPPETPGIPVAIMSAEQAAASHLTDTALLVLRPSTTRYVAMIRRCILAPPLCHDLLQSPSCLESLVLAQQLLLLAICLLGKEGLLAGLDRFLFRCLQQMCYCHIQTQALNTTTESFHMLS